MTSLISSHVKISNLSSHVRISCFLSEINPEIYAIIPFFIFSGLSMSPLSSISRGRFAVLSEKAIKLFNVSKAEVEKAKRLGRRLLSLSRSRANSSKSKTV